MILTDFSNCALIKICVNVLKSGEIVAPKIPSRNDIDCPEKLEFQNFLTFPKKISKIKFFVDRIMPPG